MHSLSHLKTLNTAIIAIGFFILGNNHCFLPGLLEVGV